MQYTGLLLATLATLSLANPVAKAPCPDKKHTTRVQAVTTRVAGGYVRPTSTREEAAVIPTTAPYYQHHTTRIISTPEAFIPTTITTSTTRVIVATTPVLTTTQAAFIPTTTTTIPVIVITTPVLTTTQAAFIPTTTTSTTALVAITTSIFQPPVNNNRYRCPGNRVPECCQTDVLDLASVTCTPPSRDPFSRRNFRAICAETGTTANCCLIPLLGQGLFCQQV